MIGLSMDRDPRLVPINPMRKYRMRALICGATLLGFVAVAAWTSRPVGAQDEEKPTIKQIMAKLHHRSKGALTTVKAELKSDSPDWSKVEADAKIIEKFGSFLPKAQAPRGDQANYEKLAKGYEKNAKALMEAAEKHELGEAKEATKKLGGTCKSCHEAHKTAS
jgi:cytochrome c556